mmetsp:Transcript_69386/g.167831  ORF Transcript_69386/g.167831 Transcript_69386/m.167831 type:complete len:516 (+) Transcript_69386:274-1821(+)
MREDNGVSLGDHVLGLLLSDGPLQPRLDPVGVVLALEVGVVERAQVRHHAAVQVASGACGGVLGENDDGAARPVLGEQACRGARVGEREDEDRLAVVGGLYGGLGDRLARAEWRLHGGSQVCHGELRVDSRLGLEAHARHHLHRLLGVLALGGLSREHHAVGAVEHGVGHVAHLGAGGARVGRHRLEHLRRADDRLAREVALCDHRLLREEDLLRRDLDAEVAARHHDAVRLRQDRVEVAHALVVLDLRDDPDLLAHNRVCCDEAGAHVLHVARLTDERGEDHIDSLRHAELQVGLVLLRERGKVDVDVGQVAPLARAELDRVDNLAGELALGRVDLLHLEGEQAVVDEDALPHLDDVADVGVVDEQRVLVLLLLLGRVRGHRDGVARGELGVLLDVHARTDLGALGVEGDGAEAAVHRVLDEALAHVGDHAPVVLVRAVGEVHAADLHARLPQHVQLLDTLDLGADRADDRAVAQRRALRVDVQLGVVLESRLGVLRQALVRGPGLRRASLRSA